MKIQKGAAIADRAAKDDLKLSVGGSKLQGKAGKEPQKPGYEPSARGTQKRKPANTGKSATVPAKEPKGAI